MSDSTTISLRGGRLGVQTSPNLGDPATTVFGPMTGPGAVLAERDIPAGFVIAATGSANYIPGDLDSYCNTNPSDYDILCRNCVLNPFSHPPNKKESCGVSGALGVASGDTPAGKPTQYVSAGPVTLKTSIWDRATGGSGGLTPNAVYYLSAMEPGHMTTVKPSSGQIIKVGVAISADTLNVQNQSLTSTNQTSEVIPDSGVANLGIDTTICQCTSAESNLITLADDTVDGREHVFLFEANHAGQLVPAHFQGGTALNFAGSVTGSCTLIWIAATSTYWLVGAPRNLTVV